MAGTLPGIAGNVHTWQLIINSMSKAFSESARFV
jgi:hypothetical protein